VRRESVSSAAKQIAEDLDFCLAFGWRSRLPLLILVFGWRSGLPFLLLFLGGAAVHRFCSLFLGGAAVYRCDKRPILSAGFSR
jgi:hypothetical protein